MSRQKARKPDFVTRRRGQLEPRELVQIMVAARARALVAVRAAHAQGWGGVPLGGGGVAAETQESRSTAEGATGVSQP